ncbi:MAG: Rrf2 family transcriptional regulator [Gemmatimonadaceae bacterium]
MLSQTAEHALRAVLYVAARGGDTELIKIDEIFAELSMPRNALSKTLNVLAREGVLISERGPHGGFRLAVPADALSLARVIAPFGSIGRERKCLLGRVVCSDRAPCAAHATWKSVSEQLSAFFQQSTIADLLRDTPPKRLRAVL